MDQLIQLIDLLDNQDKQAFKSFLNKKNTRKDAKNMLLFNFLETDDLKSVQKLYKKEDSKDAYHALRKRLQDNLLQFLSQRTFESKGNAGYDILRNIVVGRFLLENNLPKIGWKCLDKATARAEEDEQFSFLNECLLLRLQYAHLEDTIDLPQLMERFTENQEQMQREAKLHMAYAFLRRELQEIHLKGKVVNLSALIESTMKQFKISMHEIMNYKALYQLLYLANEYAAINQNYRLIEPYILKSYRYIQDISKTKEAHLYYQLYIIYYLANYHFRSRQFEESLAFLQQMEELMQHRKSYQDQFFLRHELLLGLNLHFKGEPEKAIQVLEQALQNASNKASQEDIDDLNISVCMCYAQHNQDTCLRYLAKLGHTDHWYEKKLGMLWTIRKNLMELLIHAQFDNISLANSRLQSFKRRYKSYLMQIDEERVLDFLYLVEKYFQNPDIVKEPGFQKRLLQMLDIEANQDIFNLSFLGWLLSRGQKKTPYACCLELLKKR